ncbi:MAG TPA: hypothetical protein VFJ94_12430 [Intrasporangium sp.]|uniref:AMIN-like domain-containing (lipo)protein n=1 Tax=Intrasporangium sp. TaxID=1925024 RepID=UPI002D76BB0D|nr:hypothetical protein [Intrasporangium sp.]HET7399316.1 hypothetical protein [Intrasporangium sp.]
MKRPLALSSLLAALLLVAAPSAVAADSPYCGIWWGSLDKASPRSDVTSMTNVRAGRHECFDRLVLDFEGRSGGFSVRYVPAIAGLGLAQPVDLRGGALLEIVVAEPYGPDTQTRYHPASRAELVDVTGWRTFRQVAWVELWESNNTLGLGVRARLPFRVFTLAGPGSGSRLVIDVAHRW